jgi:glucokinase
MPLEADGTIIGIDIGGTKTSVVEGTPDARILQRAERDTESVRPFSDTWPALAEQVATTITRSRALGRRPGAISVAIGGPLIASKGLVLDPPNLPGWRNVALRDAITRRFPGLPVYVEHDAKAGAMAELRFGAGVQYPDVKDMVFLTFGTGLGAGIIANRRLVRGAREMAGEIWHLAVRAPRGARVADVEDWESVASGRGIASLAARLYPSRWPVGTPVRDVVVAALADDAEASDVVTECGRWLGAGVAVLVTVLDPQLVAIGSLAVVLGERVLAPARAEMTGRLDSGRTTSCPIVPSALGARLGDVQSLMAAIEAGSSVA